MVVFGWVVKKNDTSKNFLEQLSGEIVFLAEDDAGYHSVCRVAADGGSKKILYRYELKEIGVFNPKWSANGLEVSFTSLDRKTGELTKITVDKEGNVLSREPGNNDDTTSHYTFEEDITVEKGTIYVLEEDGSRREVYSTWAYSDHWGPSYIRWGPDKKFIIFQANSVLGRDEIAVIDLESLESAVVANGRHPDWK